VPIPDYETLMLPFLKVISDGTVRHVREVRNLLAAEFGLTEHDLAERLPSGVRTVFANRVDWARTYLKKAGLIEPVSRGQHRISTRGTKLLKTKPLKIDTTLLRQYPEFQEFINPPASALHQPRSPRIRGLAKIRRTRGRQDRR
jgi:restriction system protein